LKTVKIETSSWEDVKVGDRISVLREGCRYLGIPVEENKGQLYVSEKSFGRHGSTRRTYFNQIPKLWELKSIVREVTPETPETKVKWRLSEIFKKKVDTRPKVGSQEAIQEAIDSTDSIVDYFDTRIQMGDPLFDQWMVDAHESAKASSENLRKLLKVMKGDE
jgi:hypothetical protein